MESAASSCFAQYFRRPEYRRKYVFSSACKPTKQNQFIFVSLKDRRKNPFSFIGQVSRQKYEFVFVGLSGRRK
jgi:hypothetical protein